MHVQTKMRRKKYILMVIAQKIKIILYIDMIN